MAVPRFGFALLQTAAPAVTVAQVPKTGREDAIADVAWLARDCHVVTTTWSS
jgi:hypothetical protein